MIKETARTQGIKTDSSTKDRYINSKTTDSKKLLNLKAGEWCLPPVPP
jgi:hypothetical protein